MAISNFIRSGTYTTVENINLERRERHLTFDMVVWDSPEKSSVVYVSTIEIFGDVELHKVSTKALAYSTNAAGKLESNLPEIRAEKSNYILVDAQGPFTNYITTENGDLINPHGGLIIELDGDRLEWSDDKGQFVPLNAPRITPQDFDQLFGVNAMSQEGNNLIKSIYTYLNTRVEFIDLPNV